MTNDLTPKYEQDGIEGVIAELSKPGPRIILFNKQSGAFVGMLLPSAEKHINTKFYKFKKAAHFDESTQIWQGDYDTGKIVNVDDVPTTVTETEIDSQCAYVIGSTYSWHHQINALIGCMKLLIDKNGLSGPEVDLFTEMADYIQERRDANERFKQAYKNSDDWNFMTKQDERKEMYDQLDGGLHEELGPQACQQIMWPQNNPPGGSPLL